ncbi:DUF5689 domain-containing protein [Flagellimonas onchidii]|uniref:DUF5689 domain-containing protein n=1 Tax=Flagellimonas onchidii TaxID=2562684 RepID=UPI0010A644CA|nr:DUF5689 domain-containing protein [Allomuricauda onchidii]
MNIYNMIMSFCMLMLLVSCVKGPDFDAPRQDCNDNLIANISFQELEALFEEETIQIQEDLVIEGYVISSDKSRNLYGVLVVQDKPMNPSFGIHFEIDLRESHLRYKIGDKVFVKLKGLYLGKSDETLKLGGSFTSFGNVSVGRLPAHKVGQHIFSACDNKEVLQATETSISELDNVGLNTLIRLVDIEVVDAELGETFAIGKEETERILKDCSENEIILLNSGFSDFQDERLPDGNGSVTGILQRGGGQYQIIIRDMDDINFSNERCPEIITEFTSDQILISELADPDNNSGARFIELYNVGQVPLDLNKWTLRRYTNEKTEISSSIDLSGFILESKSTLVISPNAIEFELVYGFTPDMGVSTNSPADSNGDDNLELVDPFGVIIDVFGVVGEDGSGTNHEFEDGRAIRKSEVAEANPTYTFSEWIIFNDTGESGTTKQPQNAPEGFTPGNLD